MPERATWSAPRVYAVCARRKAAFQRIIWPDLELSWLVLRVKLLQVLLALDAVVPPTHSLLPPG